MFGGFFNSESKVSTQTTTQSAGFSELHDAQAVSVQGTNNTLNLSDYGAISAARGIASDALRQVELAGSNSASTVKQAISGITEAARSDASNTMIQAFKWGAIALIGYAIVRSMK